MELLTVLKTCTLIMHNKFLFSVEGLALSLWCMMGKNKIKRQTLKG